MRSACGGARGGNGGGGGNVERDENARYSHVCLSRDLLALLTRGVGHLAVEVLEHHKLHAREALAGTLDGVAGGGVDGDDGIGAGAREGVVGGDAGHGGRPGERVGRKREHRGGERRMGCGLESRGKGGKGFYASDIYQTPTVRRRPSTHASTQRRVRHVFASRHVRT